MTESRSIPAQWRFEPWLPVGVVLVASLVPEVRLLALGALIVAFIVASFMTGSRLSIVLRSTGACIPVAVYLAWQTVPSPVAPGIDWCGDLLAPPVVRTVAGAFAVFLSVALVRLRLPRNDAQLGFVRPTSRMLAASIGAGLLVAVGSVALGTVLAGPFFGTVQLKLDNPVALLPALVFAFASGSMQEVAYRGAMLGWLTPDLGPRAALIAQAVAFGAGHGGPDFVTSPVPVMIAVAAGGAIAAYIVQRYGSLTFPIFVHAAFDIPLYYVAACRLI